MENEKKIVPQLRFSEFKDSYKEYKLSELLIRYSENNKDEEFGIDEILSLSSHYGVVDRKGLLDETYSKVNHKNYIKTSLNDIVYGKSISANYPYGLFKVNDCRDGLLSTLYYTFKVSENIIPSYFDSYFSHYSRANNFLKKYVLVGDRYITADANYILSGKIFIPTLQEQQKTTSFIAVINKQIQILGEKINLLEHFKKGVMQKLFNQKLRFKDEVGNEFNEWKNLQIGDVFLNRSEKTTEILELLSVTIGNGVCKQSEISKNDSSSRDKSNYKRVYKNDIAYNSMRMWQGAVGVSNYDGIVSPAYTILEPKSNCYPKFFEYYFKTVPMLRKFQRNSQGLTSDTWNLKYPQLSKIKISVPVIEEQIKIADFLSRIDSNIDVINGKIEHTVSFKKGLLQRMFV